MWFRLGGSLIQAGVQSSKGIKMYQWLRYIFGLEFRKSPSCSFWKVGKLTITFSIKRKEKKNILCLFGKFLGVLGCIQNLMNGNECPKSIGYGAFNTLLNNVFIHYFYKNKVKLYIYIYIYISKKTHTNTINLCLYRPMNH